MKVTDKGALAKSWLWNLKKPTSEGDSQMEYFG
jgi:hypothetical protein